MKGFLRAILALLLVGTMANAKEENGVFVGLEMGFAENHLNLKSVVQGYNYSSDSNITALAIGGKVGYKYFFFDWIGVRGYVNVDYMQTASKSDGNTTIFNDVIYGINADVIFNFYSNEAMNAGAFVGIGLGGQIFSTDAFVKTYDISDFYGDIKLGLRINAAKNHEMEFIAKIPYYKATKTFDNVIKAKAKQNYQILLGYNYAF